MGERRAVLCYAVEDRESSGRAKEGTVKEREGKVCLYVCVLGEILTEQQNTVRLEQV